MKPIPKPPLPQRPQCDWVLPKGSRCKLYARHETETGEKLCNLHKSAWVSKLYIAAYKNQQRA